MVGRKEETITLLRALSRNESQFIAVYGRRRVGKTYLVLKAFDNKFAFYHTGIFDGSYREQLDEFKESLEESGLSDCPPLSNWREAFRELRRLLSAKPDGKKIVFIDELPWMDTRNSRFVQQFDKFWNKWASARDDIVLIACGSAASWMIKNVINDYGGLHNRITDSISVKPFTLKECEEYADDLGLSMSRREVAECYMVFGGIPYYWGYLVKEQSLAQNLDRLLFARDGKLRNEFGRLFKSLFRDDKMHREVIECLGRKKAGKTRAVILSGVSFTDGGKFSECLRSLEECGFIRSFSAIGKSAKDTMFQLIDNFTLFHLEFLAGRNDVGEEFWTSTVTSSLQASWRGRAFERLCLAHVEQMKAALGISGVRTNVCSWTHAPSVEHPEGAQIDLLIDRADNVINLCEMKYSYGKYDLTPAECDKLLRRRDVFISVTGTEKSVHLTMVTPKGVAESPERHILQSEVTLDDFFR
ncbi:MAG: ATP-binding protein [Kiritimatiellae bacterium]|nr:ATP-binding protein [Kiritimatiellia bacterium]